MFAGEKKVSPCLSLIPAAKLLTCTQDDIRLGTYGYHNLDRITVTVRRMEWLNSIGYILVDSCNIKVSVVDQVTCRSSGICYHCVPGVG
jgi:hypothetical protein